MRSPIQYLCILNAFCVLFLLSCKHKEQVAKTVKKESVKNQKSNKGQYASKKVSSEVNDWYESLSMSKKQVRDNKLYSFIDDWYGTPYKYSGCTKSGVDCSCFTNICYEKVYGKKIARSTADLFAACDMISIKEAEEGDLVFFKIGGNKISHVGIFLKKKYFVHASTSMGVMVNSLEEAYYKKYFFCAGKIKRV
jgi:lipoprotein Spr